jgi:large subunit ribosomal protein L15
MPLHRRIPKRGFRNPFRREFAVVNVGQVARCFPQGGEVTPDMLAQCGLLKVGAGWPVKVLGEGAITTSAPLRVRAHAFSKSAVAKIEAAGGRAEVIAG